MLCQSSYNISVYLIKNKNIITDMLKKVVIRVIVIFLVIFILVRTNTAIKEALSPSGINTKVMKIVDYMNAHIEQMDPAVKKERAESFERLAKNLQPFIKPFFESGMSKNKGDSSKEKH